MFLYTIDWETHQNLASINFGYIPQLNDFLLVHLLIFSVDWAAYKICGIKNAKWLNILIVYINNISDPSDVGLPPPVHHLVSWDANNDVHLYFCFSITDARHSYTVARI